MIFHRQSDVATIWSETLGQKIIYGGDDLNAFEQMFRNFALGWMLDGLRHAHDDARLPTARTTPEKWRRKGWKEC
ncbi:MAG: hypothetical protein ACLP4V_03760 [Methylocella sp.]